MENNQTMNMPKLTQALFFLNAAIWLVFAILSLFRAASENGLTRGVITIMMVANAVVMFWFGVKILSGRAWIFSLAILYIALNVVLSVTDQFGWIDALILLLNLILLGLLFLARHRMNRNAKASSGEL